MWRRAIRKENPRPCSGIQTTWPVRPLVLRRLPPPVAQHMDMDGGDQVALHGLVRPRLGQYPDEFRPCPARTPALGAWIAHGLGSANKTALPSFVAMLDPRGGFDPGAANWTSGYVPAAYQGTVLRSSGNPVLNLASRSCAWSGANASMPSMP